MIALAFSASAQAQITIGQLAPGINPEGGCVNESYDGAQFGTAASKYTVPTAGVITSWSTNAAEGAGQQLIFKAYRPLGGGKYLVVGHDGPRGLAPSAIDTFPTSIPVQAGDVIGSATTSASESKTACEYHSGNLADEAWFAFGSGADGTTVEEVSEREEGLLYNETATLLPPPSIATLSPAAGSLKGGSSVAIAGTNFAEVKAVSFGTTTATSFTVNSESQITAVAPASTKLTGIPVTVTTVAGTATSPTSFTYRGCVVPRLSGKKLKAAKKKLKAAECKLGKVTKKKGATPKSGKVGKQSPKAGKVLAPGSKVKVTLKA